MSIVVGFYYCTVVPVCYLMLPTGNPT